MKQSEVCTESGLLKLTAIAFHCEGKFHQYKPRLKAITNAMIKMMIKDVQPAYTVEREGFREYLNVLVPQDIPLYQGNIFNSHCCQITKAR